MAARPVSIDERGDVDVKVDSRQVGTDGGVPVVRQVVALGAGDSPDDVLDTSTALPVRERRVPDVSTFGEQTSVSHFHEIAVQFSEDLTSEPIATVLTGDGAFTQPAATPGQAKLAASTGTALARTSLTVPYRSGHETRALCTAAFTGLSDSGVTRRVGVFASGATSGFWFGDVDGVWSVGRIYDGVETVTAATLPTLTDDDGVTSVMDPTRPHIYRFRFGWLGYDALTIEVHNAGEGTDELWVPLHRFYFINESDTDPSLSDPDVHVHMDITNTSGTETSILTNSWTIGPVLGFLGGIQPDGDIVYPKATGTAASDDTPLGTSGMYQSGLLDHDGWSGIAVTVKTDQASASDGLLLEWYETIDGVDVMIDSTVRTFGAEAVVDGAQTFRFAPIADKVQVTYTNGAVAQTEFVIAVVFYSTTTELPRGPLDGSVGSTSESVMTRGAVMGPDPDAGATEWDNVTATERTVDGTARRGLDVFQVGSEPVEPKAATSAQHGSHTAGTAATQVDVTPLSGERTIALINVDNNTDAYIGFTSAVTTSTGFPLMSNGGNSVELAVTSDVEVWVIAASANTDLRWMEVA